MVSECQAEINSASVLGLALGMIPPHLPTSSPRSKQLPGTHLTPFQPFEGKLGGLGNVYSAVCPTVKSLPFRNILNKSSVVYTGQEPFYLKWEPTRRGIE